MDRMISRLGFAVAAITLIALAAQPARSEGTKVNWTGCYGGGGLGMASTVTKADAEIVGVGNLLTVDGVGTGGAAWTIIGGCDVQVGRFVVGAFADYTWHDQTWSVSSGLLPGTIASLDIQSQWTIGGRAGVTVGNALVYGLVGYTRLTTGDLSIPIIPISFTVPEMTGWALGGGVDLALGNGFHLGAEYRYQMFDRETIALVPNALNLGLEPDMHTIQGRLTYRFGLGAPASMK